MIVMVSFDNDVSQILIPKEWVNWEVSYLS